ncbi:unnamed protein product [Cylicocyclus nassatus]|uniref:Uncharacterized protein n=1 Tax=Cylicocyclus nassatus TaxID=53992 RepID=A0AA36HBT7_CYLNA|nr:unnamed protein product [Cylicocyclus nassatus]
MFNSYKQKSFAALAAGKRRRQELDQHDFKFLHFNPTFFATDVLATYPIKLEERMICNADAKAPPKLILSWNTEFSQENLGGCPDWNCRLIDDKDKIKEADAV